MAIVKKLANSAPGDGELLPVATRYKNVAEIYLQAEKLNIETDPFDIANFLRAHGIRTIYEEAEPDFSGYLEKRANGCWIVGINKYQNERRQRFTMAHEFAHFLFHSAGLKDSDRFSDQILLRSADINPQERQANEFAAQLLMPRERFNAYVDSGIRNMEELAERFDVSMAAVRYRAYKLGYIKTY